jgi:DNA adenine methylase
MATLYAHTDASRSLATPILRWAGSKRALLPKLLEKVPTVIEKYIEPFAGSACLFFKIGAGSAIIGDANVDLIETYQAIKADPTLVSQVLRDMPVSKDDYYFVRGLNTATLKDHERAARFVYLNRFCFNGLYRTNTLGQFNVPYGAPKTLNIPSEEELIRVSVALRNTTLVCDDFEGVVKHFAGPGDFVYLDPPFYRRTERTFREYNARPFDGSDLVRLVDLLHWLDERQIRFLVSYAFCPEAVEAFKDWHSTIASTARNISGFAVHRRRSEEMLISNQKD